ncbi:MAG: hypothetical protein WCG62_06525 [Actinomycetes bacterium]
MIPGIVTGGVVGGGNVTGPGPLGGAVGGGDVGQVAKPQGESTGGVAGPCTPVPGPLTWAGTFGFTSGSWDGPSLQMGHVP